MILHATCTRRGSALPVALVMTVMLAALGTFLFVPIRDHGELVSHEEAKSVALTSAESAIDVAIQLLCTDTLPAGASTDGLVLNAVQGAVNLLVTPVAGHADTWLIESSVLTSGSHSTRVALFAAVRLGEPGVGGVRAVAAFALGRTTAVAQAVRPVR